MTDEPPVAWKVSVEPGRRDVLFSGPEGHFRAEIFCGGLVPDLFNGLRALESPVMAAYILGNWKVSVPRVFRNWTDNVNERRFLVIQGDHSQEFVLDFRRDKIPQALLRSLKHIFHRPEPQVAQGEQNEGHDQAQRAPEAAGSPRQGKHPVHGQFAYRQGRRREHEEVGG